MPGGGKRPCPLKVLSGQRATPVKWFRVRKGIRRIISSTAPEKSFFKGGTVQARALKKVREREMLKAIQYFGTLLQ